MYALAKLLSIRDHQSRLRVFVLWITRRVKLNDGVDSGVRADWVPLSEEVLSDVVTAHAQLRAHCPVAHSTPAGGLPAFWALSRYEDVTAVARDAATFANALDTRLPIRRVPLESDPPEHGKIRRFLQRYFTPGRLAAFEPQIRIMASDMLTPAVHSGGGDLALELARPLPAKVLLTFLGQPTDKWLILKEQCEEQLASLTLAADGRQRSRDADVWLWTLSRQIVAARRAVPLDPERDVLSGLIALSIDGAPIADDLVVGFVRLLIAAGHESTTSALSICLLHLACNLEHQNALRRDLSLIPDAVEEILRYKSPVIMMPRTVARDVTLHGRELRRGDRIMLLWASANRDHNTFPDADTCVLGRSPNRHVAFGHGIHSCLGASLARLEIRIALEELLSRTREFRLASPETHEHWHRHGVRTMPSLIVSANS
jgi:cytochrome P450